ncbi:MAG: tRNA-dihydrouridine synthase, partial [Eubacteriaceae bacterium]|nr:tRNA-dihydrouridine synthase [Eubacteriaceae bacterium]
MSIFNFQNKPVFLAPMAGYTDLPFRLFSKKFGADAVTTEMVSAKGLYYGDQKTAKLLATDAE